MFTLLLKHEWKRSSGLLAVLSLAALGVGVLGGIAVRLIAFLTNEMLSSYHELEIIGPILISMLTMLLFLLFLALFAYVAGTNLLLLFRFYKSRFTDEGYLTFTLPVNVHENFCSALINLLAWSLISVLTTLLSVLLGLVIGTASEKGLINPDVFSTIGMIIRESFEIYNTVGMTAAMIVTAILAPIAGTVSTMSCIVIGSVLAKKHKLLASFGIYYGVNAVTSLASSVLTVLPVLIMMDTSPESAMNFSIYAQLFVAVALAVGGYFLSTWLMRHKLNLP